MWYLILLGLGYLLLCFLLWFQCFRTLRLCGNFLKSPVFIVIFSLIYLMFVSSIGLWQFFTDRAVVRWFKYLNNIWIGILVYAVFFGAIAEIICLILRLAKKFKPGTKGYEQLFLWKGIIVIVLVLSFSAYGLIHAQSFSVASYNAEIHKTTAAGDSLKLVLVADTHLGYSVGEKQMDALTDLINEQEPDMVVFAGDIIDNDYYALDNPEAIAADFASIKARYGKYGVWGNHDVYEKLIGGFSYSLEDHYIQEETKDWIKSCGITMLQDETVTVAGDITLVGRSDKGEPDTADGTRPCLEELLQSADLSHPVILLEHEPGELDEAATVGVDLALGGHTHDGQIFPGNLTINLAWDNAYGIYKIGNLTSVVTSGAGVWGPAMRVGTDCEIAVVYLHFK